ncbi:MAG: hypothetical protein PHW24_02145 [Candidatus Moranbacteria bacterium]|jgi:hypothetical protein|nr:hypothetical protein [Candidatus Moranbacteria bacterium]
MQSRKKNKNFDIGKNGNQQEVVDLEDIPKSNNFNSVLFSRGKKSSAFFTEDSKLYISPREQELLRKGVLLDRDTKKWDSLSSRIVNKFVYYSPSKYSLLLEALENRYTLLNQTADETFKIVSGQFTIMRLWNASIVGSILFGMVMMTFVYRYLGQGAAASTPAVSAAPQSQTQPVPANAVSTADDAASFAQQVMEIQKADDKKSLESEIRKMVKGYPIEKMAPDIAKQDRTVAAFIVAIAKKESSWGVHVPVLNGQDCFNYWGYRGQRKLMGTGGHTCFNSPADAVETVAKRINTLVEQQGKDTPAEMVKTWKCGGNCAATGGQAAANKWVSDVNSIFKEFDREN